MIVIGIDPGLSGAVVVVHDGIVTRCHDTPVVETVVNGKKRRRIDPHGLVGILTSIGPVNMVVLEQAGARPGEGATSSFTNGRNFGVIEGVLATLARPYTTVAPQTWTKQMRVGPDKGNHRLEAMRLFPASADLFARVKDDGRADAALLASWWTR